MKQSKKLPIPGQRIIRSAIAVALCLVVYVLRGYSGIPLYSAMAALQCIQPYTRDMRGVARKRVLGTVIGAVWGLLLLLIEIQLINSGMQNEILHYILVPLFLILVLYSTVLMKVPETAYFSGIVFLVITINHFTDADPYIFAFNRLLDTVIGVLVAAVVNRMHLPRNRNLDTLYVSSLGDDMFESNNRISPYSLVELNRLIDDGAKFTISTDQTQATVRELMPGIRFKYPLITMDGAALYDMQNLEYIRTQPMAEENAERLIKWLRDRNIPFFSNSIEQNLLVIRYSELANPAMAGIFEKKNHSPYRNYIKSDKDFYENIVYLLVIDKSDVINKIRDELSLQEWHEDYRIVDFVMEYEGYSALKIYDKDCTQKAMLVELEKIMNTKETVTFGYTEGEYDVVIHDYDKNHMVRELKHRFEPVNIRGWKNVFRL